MEGNQGLARKALLGVAKFFAGAAILLFGCAGALDYWQGWLFLGVLGTCILLLTLHFLRADPGLVGRRLAAGPAAEKEISQKKIQTLTSVASALLVVISALDHRFRWSRVPAAIVLAADVGIVVANVMTFFVFRENSFASAIVEVGQNQKVIATGPYRRVRHPMYSASLLLFSCIPLALGSYWGLLAVPLIVGSIVWRLWDEERLLVRDLPGYEDYRRRTPYRLIPLLW